MSDYANGAGQDSQKEAVENYDSKHGKYDDTWGKSGGNTTPPVNDKSPFAGTKGGE